MRLLLGVLRLGGGLPTPLALGPGEQARLDATRDPRRAAQYLGGRWLLRRLASEWSGSPFADIRLNAGGAPVASLEPGPAPAVPGVPSAGRMPHLSLTHSGDWVAATACASAAGVDLEVLGRARDWPALARHLRVAEGSEAAVLKAWTLKEARFKAQEAGGLVTWRLAGRGWVGCVAAPPACRPEALLFGGADAGPLGLHMEN